MMDCYEGGEGPPLVLLHGLGGSWHVWQPVLSMLGDGAGYLHRHCPAIPAELHGRLIANQPWTRSPICWRKTRSTANRSAAHRRQFARRVLALELARRGIATSVTAFSPAGAWRSDRDYQAVARPFRTVHALMPLLVAVARPLLRFAGVRRALNAQAMEHGDRVSADEVLRAMQKHGWNENPAAASDIDAAGWSDQAARRRDSIDHHRMVRARPRHPV